MKIACSNCRYTSCRQCVKMYLLGSSLEPSCMNCKFAWNAEFIRTVMPKSFVDGEYKTHRSKMLLSLEESLLPQTQRHLEFKRAKEEAKEEAMEEMQSLKEQIANLQRQLFELKMLHQNKKYDYERKFTRNNASSSSASILPNEFALKCPKNYCRGFLSTHYKCGVCANIFCKHCHAQKTTDEHTCKEDDVKTVQMLQKDTKPCPKCRVPIFKMYGCDQMWCTNCRTPFSWVSGTVINNATIHNPHYFDWQRQRHREDGDGEEAMCGVADGDIPDISQFRFLGVRSDEFERVGQLIRVLGHTRDVVIPSLNREADRFTNNLNIRIDYLTNKLSRDEFAMRIHKRDKATEKKRMVMRLLETFVTSYTDILNNLLTDKDFVKFEAHNLELHHYVNSELHRIAKIYGTKHKYLDENWELRNVDKPTTHDVIHIDT